MNLAILKSEITVDPVALGYTGKTDQQICDLLNAKARSRNLTSLTPSQVLNAVDLAEWGTRTAAQQTLIWNLMGMGQLNPFGIEATLFVQVFGASSATITTLKLLRVQAISRAEEIGLEIVYAGHIAEARAY